MPKKASGEIHTCLDKVHKKNGDVYVYEKNYYYNPENKKMVTVSRHLIGKIEKGSSEIVNTRPKRNNKFQDNKKTSKPNVDKQNQKKAESEDNAAAENAEDLKARKQRVGMMDIIDHIGKESGIDDIIYKNIDAGTAQKIISVARYLFASDGGPISGVFLWQLTHPIPYVEGLSEDICHDLFVELGTGQGDSETLKQRLFKYLYEISDNDEDGELTNKIILAYDSTFISTYGKLISDRRYAFDKDKDGLEKIKLLMLYRIEAFLPTIYTKGPANIPDVVQIKNCIKQISALKLKDIILVTDCGYSSEENIGEMIVERIHFITKISKDNHKWVMDEVKKVREGIRSIANECPFEVRTYGVTVEVEHNFFRIRKYGSKKKGLKAGEKEYVYKKVYLHIYFSSSRKERDENDLDHRVRELRKQLEDGVEYELMDTVSKKYIDKFITISVNKDGTKRYSYNLKNIEEENKYHGFYVLVSDTIKDRWKVLKIYRKREHVEDCFESWKNHDGGDRTRVWYSDTLDGRMFCQFIAQCYRDYFTNKIRKIKKLLGVKNGDTRHDLKKNLQTELKLRTWLSNVSIHDILIWFDVVEEYTVSRKMSAKRWTTEIIARDQLLLDMLGVPRRR